jgi:hypothetical protein
MTDHIVEKIDPLHGFTPGEEVEWVRDLPQSWPSWLPRVAVVGQLWDESDQRHCIEGGFVPVQGVAGRMYWPATSLERRS